MVSDREKWNQRYSEREFAIGRKPSSFLAANIQMLVREAPGRAALDVACGEGRNSIFLAEAGFDVVGVDNSDVALGRARAWAGREGLTIGFEHLDLAAGELPPGPFDVIIVFNFLQRNLLPALHARLTPGGFFMMESILSTPENAGSHKADYALQPGELARLFSDYSGTIISLEEQPARERAIVFFRTSAG